MQCKVHIIFVIRIVPGVQLHLRDSHHVLRLRLRHLDSSSESPQLIERPQPGGHVQCTPLKDSEHLLRRQSFSILGYFGQYVSGVYILGAVAPYFNCQVLFWPLLCIFWPLLFWQGCVLLTILSSITLSQALAWADRDYGSLSQCVQCSPGRAWKGLAVPLDQALLM